MLRVCPLHYPPPPPPGNSASANQQLYFLSTGLILRSFVILTRSLYNVVVRVEASGQGGCRFYSRQKQCLAFMGGGGNRWRAGTYRFCVQGGDGWRASTRGEGQARRPVQNISDGGGGLSLPAQELTHWSLYNIIMHKRLSHRQQFSASQDADSISLVLNNNCPQSHFHTGNCDYNTTQRLYRVP